MTVERVVIVGSGAVGGMTGIYLRRLGYDVTIIERKQRIGLGSNQVASVAHFTGSEYPCDPDSGWTGKDCILGGIAMKQCLPDFIYGTEHDDPDHARFFLSQEAADNGVLSRNQFDRHSAEMTAYYLKTLKDIAIRRGISPSSVAEALHGDPAKFIVPLRLEEHRDVFGMIAGYRTVTSTLRAPAFAALIASQLCELGANILIGKTVSKVVPSLNAFEVHLEDGLMCPADQVILCSGFDNMRLAESSGTTSRSASTIHLNLATYVTVPSSVAPSLVFTLLDKYGGMCCPVVCSRKEPSWLAMLYWPSPDGSQIASARFHENQVNPPPEWTSWLLEDHAEIETRGNAVLNHMRKIYPFLKSSSLHHAKVRTVANPWGPVREIRRFRRPKRLRSGIHSVVATKFTHVALSAIECVTMVQQESILHGRRRTDEQLLPNGFDIANIPEVLKLRSCLEPAELVRQYSVAMDLV